MNVDNPKLLTRKELASQLGIHPQTLTKLMKALDVTPPDSRGKGKRSYLTPAEITCLQAKLNDFKEVLKARSFKK